MRSRFFTLCAMLIIVCGLVGLTGCEDTDKLFDFPGDDANDDGNNNNNGGGGGGAADIDVTGHVPASVDTNISGNAITVVTETFVGTGAGGFTNGVNYTRVILDATTDGFVRQLLVYFETATGALTAVSYSWGVASAMENSVHCPAAGCTGVSVNTATKEVSFANTDLDNSDPFGGAPTKFATVSLGIIQYP